MSSGGGRAAAWIVAGSIGAVEALKDQGVCRWNYVLRSIQQHAKNRVQSYYHTHVVHHPKPSSSSSSAGGMVAQRMMRDFEKVQKTEKSLNRVMDLSCWGPTTVRF
ncbi:UNVERIFIED_CONTAM: hypothetical protein Scaly_1228300 [Sesamum calycinum]|uniref:Wound-responsive family protein n=3 Tax=Sesamum TaxID=4181 RepID=A0AAW2Q5B7_9LAMI